MRFSPFPFWWTLYKEGAPHDLNPLLDSAGCICCSEIIDEGMCARLVQFGP